MTATTTHKHNGRPPTSREPVRAAIIAAGLAGISSPELEAALGLSSACIKHQIHALRKLGMPIGSKRLIRQPARYWADVAWVPPKPVKPPKPPKVAKVKPPKPVKPPTRAERIQAWLDANPAGGAPEVIAAALGIPSLAASSLLSTIAARGAALSMPAPIGKAVRRRHYYAVQHADQVRAAIPAPTLQVKKPPPAFVPNAPVDYSRAKVTQCPSGKDHRFTATEVTPMFSALAAGSYLPADTWASRAGFGA